MSQPVDVLKFRREDKIKLRDGRELEIRNVYMSTTGIMVVAKGNTAGICDQNIPLAEIVEHKERNKKDAS